MTLVDPVAVRDHQRMVWDGVSGGWQRWRRRFELAAGLVTARLLEMAAVGPGDTVLDIGSGVGEPAISAARVVTPTGRVVGIDLSPAMIAGARRSAAGLENVEFVIGDLETAILPLDAFDAVVSRWALMFAADRIEMLRAAARRLKPGRTFAAAVWGAPADAPAISLAFRSIAEHLALPTPPPGPGPFSMADPATAAAELHEAGLDDISVEEVVVPFRFASVDEFVRYSRDLLPPPLKDRIRAERGSHDASDVWAAVRAAASEFALADGTVDMPSRALCLRGINRDGS